MGDAQAPAQSEHCSPRKRTSKKGNSSFDNNVLNVNMFALSIPDDKACSLSSKRIVADDIKTMTAAELAHTYVHEAGTHARILSDKRRGRCKVDPAFQSFRSFLKHVGPVPDRSWTLDRVDPSNSTYGPGLVRWATKREQANNRRNTVHLRGPNGAIRPLTEWASLTQQAPATIRRRLDRGYSHEEAISGKRTDSFTAPPVAPPKTGRAFTNEWPPTMNQSPRLLKAYEVFSSRFRRLYPTLDRRLGSRAILSLYIAWREQDRATRALESKYPDWYAGGDPPENLAADNVWRFSQHYTQVEREARNKLQGTPNVMDFLRSLSSPVRDELMGPVLAAIGWGGWTAANED